MVDIVKFLKEMDEKSRANIAATQRRQQPLKQTKHGFQARGYVEPGQLKTHEQMYPGHRAAAQKAGVGGIAKFFTPEHKKWIAGNRAQMGWLPKDQPKYYGEDWRRLTSGLSGTTTPLPSGPPIRRTPVPLAALPGRNPPRPPWSAGQTRLPNQRVPSKAQVTVTDVDGQPSKTVTKYELEDTGLGPRMSDPINTRPGTVGGSLHHPASIISAPALWRMRGINRVSGSPPNQQGFVPPQRVRNMPPRNWGLSGTTTPLPSSPPISGSPTFPRSEAMRRHFENNPALAIRKGRDWDVDHVSNEASWNYNNESYEEYLRRVRNPWPEFYRMRESEYYPHYGRSNY